MSNRDLWLIIYLAIVLVVLSVLWVVQLLANSEPPHWGVRKTMNKEYRK